MQVSTWGSLLFQMKRITSGKTEIAGNTARNRIAGKRKRALLFPMRYQIQIVFIWAISGTLSVMKMAWHTIIIMQ